MQEHHYAPLLIPLRRSVGGVVQAALILSLLLFCVVGLVTVGPGRMEITLRPGLRSPRPLVIWTAWIGSLNLAVNASSLVYFLVVIPSIVAGLLFWLLPYSLVLGVIDVAVYVRERKAVSGSSGPPKRWAVTLVLALSIVMFGLVVLCIIVFHGAQLGNSFDPGGL
jgi:hypothetical protein